MMWGKGSRWGPTWSRTRPTRTRQDPRSKMTISVPAPNTTVPPTGAPGITYHGRSTSPNPNTEVDDMNKEKPEIHLDEHAIGFEGEDADPNSPAAILKRYPLLRNMTGEELERLNKQTRRRMWVSVKIERMGE
jgi:hypothetical protein